MSGVSMRIATVLLRYDYGKISRGDSLEYVGFYSALKRNSNDVCCFWYDEYLGKKENLQEDVIKFIDDVDPDLVFFVLLKSEFLFKTLDYLKQNYNTVNWFADDQWRFEEFTKYYAPHFTYAITTDKTALIRYKQIGYNNVILSQWASFGCDKSVNPEKVDYKYDVSFVGSANGYRRWIVNELSRNGINVECFGNGWDNGRITYEDMACIFKESRINLNISNSASHDMRYVASSLTSLCEFFRSKKRAEQIKARNFEIPAFGGFQLTNYVSFIEDYFDIGMDIAIYTSIDDLVNKIKYYLEYEEERRKIATNGLMRAAFQYTYDNIMKQIIDKIEAKR